MFLFVKIKKFLSLIFLEGNKVFKNAKNLGHVKTGCINITLT